MEVTSKERDPKDVCTLALPVLLKADGIGGNRREYQVQLIQAGKVRLADGSFADWTIPVETLAVATAAGLFEDIACMVDHPNFFEGPKARDLAGVYFASMFDDVSSAVLATLRLYGREDLAWLGQLLDEVALDLAEGQPVPDVGFSLVFYGQHEENEETGERITTNIYHVSSCDVVFGPAAEGRLIKALSMAGGDTPGLNVVHSEVVSMSEKKVVVQDAPLSDGGMVNLLTGFEDRIGEIESALSDAVPATAAPGYDDRLGAIEDSMAQLSRAIQANVIQGMGKAPLDNSGQGVKISEASTGLDRAQNDVDWIFGVNGAATPPPQRRHLRDIYLATTGDHNFTGVYNPDLVMLAGASPTTLPDLAVNAMNKIIIEQWVYLQAYRWFEVITRIEPNDGSRHNMQWITYGGVANLPAIADGAAYTELDLVDARETDSWEKHGGYVSITRNMILNSDIQRLQSVPRSLAVGAVRTRSTAVSDIFTSNSGVGPTLDEDSTALFHADHSNIATTAIGSDTTAWDAAALEIYKHTELGSAKRIGIWPRYCLVPGDLYRTALANFGYSDAVPTAHDPNFNDRGPADPRPIPVAVPDWTDANDWAAIVDPVVFPVIHITYGQDSSGRTHPVPELFTAQSQTGGLLFTNDKLPIKVRDEWAVGVSSAKGVSKRNVA